MIFDERELKDGEIELDAVEPMDMRRDHQRQPDIEENLSTRLLKHPYRLATVVRGGAVQTPNSAAPPSSGMLFSPPSQFTFFCDYFIDWNL